MSNRRRKIFHLHIPKTGGQTLSSQIAAAFPVGLSRYLEPDLVHPNDCGVLNDLLGTHEFVSAHVRGPLLQDSGLPIDILCGVRNPVDCIVSSYQHIRIELSNPLHRPARELSPVNFINLFKDWFADYQTINFVGAFVPCRPLNQIEGRGRWVDKNIDDCIARCRWLFPTEKLGEFVSLFAMENQLPVLDRGSVNAASGTDSNAAVLRDYLQRRPDIWSRDMLFWTKANQAFQRYKHDLVERYPSEARVVFASSGNKITLRRGWHLPQQIKDVGLFWASGPEDVSSLEYVREEACPYLQFNVAVYTWVSADQIAITNADGKRLPISQEGKLWTVDLSGEPLSGEIFILVPNTFCSMQFVDGAQDLRRTAIIVDRFMLSQGQ